MRNIGISDDAYEKLEQVYQRSTSEETFEQFVEQIMDILLKYIANQAKVV